MDKGLYSQNYGFSAKGFSTCLFADLYPFLHLLTKDALN